jgi:hypothetical protein
MDGTFSQAPVYRVGLIEPQKLRAPQVAAAVAPLLDRALSFARGQYTLAQVADLIDEGVFALWGVVGPDGLSAVFVTDIDRDFASGPVLTVVLMGGEQSNLWLHLEPVVADYARARGCTKMMLIGRRGWSRVLKHWRQAAVVLERDLTDERTQQNTHH